MEELNRLEAQDKIKSESQRIRSFHKEINDTFDKNLDNCLDSFIFMNNLDDSDIGFWLRKYNNQLKRVRL